MFCNNGNKALSVFNNILWIEVKFEFSLYYLSFFANTPFRGILIQAMLSFILTLFNVKM